MLGDAQVAHYLDRLQYGGTTVPGLATLQALHRAHICHLPFENLDIFLGRRITLTTDSLFGKLVAARRGGICYELNYLFHALLSALGFEVQLLSAEVFNGKAYGKAFAHLLLLVTVDGERFIADVGFGDSFREPLGLYGPASIQLGVGYQIAHNDNYYTLFQLKDDGVSQAIYRFSLTAHGIEAFHEMCVYQQTSPDSHFTDKTICSIATEDGRLSISNRRLIRTTLGNRTEQIIETDAQYLALLQSHFCVSLPYAPPMDKLS
jgi:N-hydroxyarylamine O-acetyltransferase